MARVTNPGDFTNLPGAGAPHVSFGPMFNLTPPIDADFSWINQGTTTKTDLGGAISLLIPAAAGPSNALRVKAVPGGNYTIDIAVLALMPAVNVFSCGFVWRQNDGKLVTHSLNGTATNRCLVSTDNWNSATSFSGAVASVTVAGAFTSVMFLRAADNGTNRVCSFSTDGQTYYPVSSAGRTTFITATQVGFFVKAENATYNNAMTLIHWKES